MCGKLKTKFWKNMGQVGTKKMFFFKVTVFGHFISCLPEVKFINSNKNINCSIHYILF